MDANDVLQQAMEAHTRGDFQRAAGLYRGALVLAPELIDARHLLGAAQARNGQVLKGLRSIRDVLRVIPDHPVAQANHRNLSAALPHALLRMRRFADLDPPDPDLSATGNWHAVARPNEHFRISRIPEVVAMPGTAAPDLFEQAAMPFDLEQRSGTATLTHLKNVHLDASSNAIFSDEDLYLESCTLLDPSDPADDVDFGSPKSIFVYTDNFIVESHQDFEAGGTTHRFGVRTALMDTAPYIDFPCVWLYGAENYYHWLLEDLTRVQVLRDLGVDDRSLRYVIRNRPAAIVLESLERLGISRDRVLFLTPQTYRFRSLFVPSRLVTKKWVAPRLIQFLHDHLPPPSRPGLPRRFFVSRNDASMRRVSNEEEILQRLEPYGVVRVSLGDMSLAGQTALFAQAELVIGPHGAAMANLAFCRETTSLIELSPYRWHPCFGELSGLVGCPHYLVFPRREVQKVGRVPATFGSGCNPLRMEFDPALVEHAVRRALQGG